MGQSEVNGIIAKQTAKARRDRARFEKNIKDYPASELRRLISDPELQASYQDCARRLLSELDEADAAQKRKFDVEFQERSVLAAEQSAKAAVDSARFARIAIFISMIAILISIWPLMFPK